jgi:hypothetical protein
MNNDLNQPDENIVTQDTENASSVSSSTENENAPISSTGKTHNFNIANIKNYFGYVVIGGVILTAIMAIFAIFVGEFNSYILKALASVFWMTVHVLLALVFVNFNSSNSPFWKTMFVNIAFAITIASFFTSFLSIWEIINEIDTINLYEAYWWGLVSSAFIALLIKINISDDKNTGIAIKTTIGLVALEFVYSLFWIFSYTPDLLGELYWKFFATFSILLGTSSILVVVLRRIYVSKHPELFVKAAHSTEPKRSHILRNILIILAVIYLLPFILSTIGNIFR